MILSFIWLVLFGFFYVGAKRDAERESTRENGYWHGWNAAMLLYACCELLSKILKASGY